MREKVFRSSLVFVMAMAMVIGFTFSPAMAEKKFGLDDIPKIKNRTPIHVALEAGGGADLIIPWYSSATVNSTRTCSVSKSS